MAAAGSDGRRDTGADARQRSTESLTRGPARSLDIATAACSLRSYPVAPDAALAQYTIWLRADPV